MKNLVIILFTIILGFNVNAQMRRDMNRIPQTRSEPTEQEIAKQKRMIEDRKNEFIDNFLTTLEGDEFQKEIVKQHLNTFYDAKLAILKTPFDRSFEREQAVKKLEDNHFLDLKNLISEDDMSKIKEMIRGKFDEKEVKKERKKRKKRKEKDNG